MMSASEKNKIHSHRKEIEQVNDLVEQFFQRSSRYYTKKLIEIGKHEQEVESVAASIDQLKLLSDSTIERIRQTEEKARIILRSNKN
jgi:ElaB/YqjD/DUF883 family membrane-anchored ribosome-binding protein